jgi:hypothetical protein
MVALAACQPARAEHRVHSRPIVIPIEIRNGLIVVRSIINGHPALLIVDSGSGISVLDTSFVREAGVELSERSAEVKGTAGTTVRLGTARSVQLGGTELSGVAIASVPLDAVRGFVGHDIRGTLGFDLFDQYVVDIDYAAHTLTLSEPATYVYHGIGVSVPLTVSRRVPVLSASLTTRTQGTIPAHLHLDLGASGYALRLATPFVRAHSLMTDTTTMRGVLGVGVGGLIKGDLLRLPALALGGITVHRPSTALSREVSGAFGESAETDGAIGASVWSRMHLIVDYSRSHVILEPRGDLETPDAVSGTGISIAEDVHGTRALRVAYVLEPSAGASAGVRAGDELIAIDGRPVSGMSVANASMVLRTTRAPMTLEVKRGDESRKFTLVPREIF